MKAWYRMVSISLLIIAGIMLTACESEQVTGNGKVITKSRSIQDFQQLIINGAYKVEIVQVKKEFVKITTDSNIIPLVMTEVKGSTLTLHNKPGVSVKLTRPVLVQIGVNRLTHVVSSGDNQIIISKLQEKNLLIDTNGTAAVNLSGRLDKLELQVSGSGNINASNLMAKNVTVRLLGSGMIRVNVINKLDTKITGNGTIQYKGDPDVVQQSIVGSGTLERVE